MKNIESFFIQWEWYCEYSQDQIKLMREKIFKNLNSEDKEKNIDKIPARLPDRQAAKLSPRSSTGQADEMTDGGYNEEEWDYILGLA